MYNRLDQDAGLACPHDFLFHCPNVRMFSFLIIIIVLFFYYVSSVCFISLTPVRLFSSVIGDGPYL